MPGETETGTIGSNRQRGRLSGKTAVITGGAAGMGRVSALAFAKQGAVVAILDNQKEAGEEVEHLIRKTGGFSISWFRTAPGGTGN